MREEEGKYENVGKIFPNSNIKEIFMTTIVA